MSSQLVGTGIAGLGAIIFFYYSTWIFITVTHIQPFISNTHWIQNFFIDRVWAIIIPQFLLLSGLTLITLLALLTLLCSRKAKVA